ncbi:MAG: 5'-nucleotidase C-terminal domain-containing protein [Acidobacteriota bacterium]|nr:5'-nucleotidase C-terminal domain-containing protein [Acidobacteriota bacterium]
MQRLDTSPRRRLPTRIAEWAFAALILPVLLLAGACSTAPSAPTDPAASPPSSEETAAESAAENPQERSFTILSINDVYRITGLYDGSRGGPARVRTLRRQLEADHPDLLVFHAGDFLYPSLLSRLYHGEQMVDVLNLLDGDAQAFDPHFFITFGNHELDAAGDEGATQLDQRLAQSQFRWITSNLHFQEGGKDSPEIADPRLTDHVLTEAGGVRVGIFAVTLDNQQPSYVRAIDDPIETARRYTALLRGRGAEVVIGLTHLELEEDLLLLETLREDGPDLILGGHEHDRQRQQAGGRWVFKADADAVSAVVATLTVGPEGGVTVDQRFEDLMGDEPPPDPLVSQHADAWIRRHEQEFCTAAGLPSGCLGRTLGTTQTRLVGEELAIRSRETSLGNWVADQLRAELQSEGAPDQGAQVAVINSGGLRLNRDLPAGSPVSRRDLEELFAFPNPTVLLQIDVKTLEKMLQRSVEQRGEGAWLQVSGLAFRYDPDRQRVLDLTLLAPEGPRPLEPGEVLRVATVNFLADPAIGDQDGYTMLGLHQRLARGGSLEKRALKALQAAGTEGIAPTVEGRICAVDAPGPCLAVASP